MKPPIGRRMKMADGKKRADMKLKYRLLTGVDDRSFCEKISNAIEDGYELYGSPSATFNGENVIVAQAVTLIQRPKETE